MQGGCIFSVGQSLWKDLTTVCFYLSFSHCVMVWVTCPQLYTFSFLNKLWPTHNMTVSLLPTEDQEKFYNLTPYFSDIWERRWDNRVLKLPNTEKIPREVLSLQLCLKVLIRLFAGRNTLSLWEWTLLPSWSFKKMLLHFSDLIAARTQLSTTVKLLVFANPAS